MQLSRASPHSAEEDPADEVDRQAPLGDEGIVEGPEVAALLRLVLVAERLDLELAERVVEISRVVGPPA